jgi:hypothetical protein
MVFLKRGEKNYGSLIGDDFQKPSSDGGLFCVRERKNSGVKN